MLEYRPTPLATVSPGIPSLLADGYYVRFSDHWPATLTQIADSDNTSPTGVRGKFFQVGPVNQVPYDLSYKIPANDFRDVDFSNVASAFNENLYPTNNRTLYETAMGWKEANMLAQFYIPAGEYVNRLEQASMVPNVTSPTLRYLGAKKPSDSPYDDKRVFFYSVFNMEPFILRLFVDNGVQEDKIVMGLIVNKCYLTEIPSPTDEQLKRAKLIRYYSELRWNS